MKSKQAKKNIEPTPKEQSAAYESLVWDGDTYGGLVFKLASRKTPLLEGFIDLVRANLARVIEAGPGAGGHTIKLAQEGFHITSVESSSNAVERIMSRRTEHGLEGQIDVVTGCIFDYISKLFPGEQRHFYAQGVFQFFSNDDRQNLLRCLSTMQQSGGVIGGSFKTKYDVLLHPERVSGELVNDQFGTWARASDGSGSRLFVNVDDMSPLLAEFTDNGYDVIATPRWYEVDCTDRKKVFSLPSVESKPTAKNPVDWIGILAVKK